LLCRHGVDRGILRAELDDEPTQKLTTCPNAAPSAPSITSITSGGALPCVLVVITRMSTPMKPDVTITETSTRPQSLSVI
jgi:hypothetical protein